MLGDSFLDTLLAWSLEHADNDLQRSSAWHIISSVTNKRAEGESCKYMTIHTNSLLYLRRAGILEPQVGPLLERECYRQEYSASQTSTGY